MAPESVYASPWFVAFVCVLLFLLIGAALFAIVAFRRVAIAAKKIDYLAEDLAYKAEKAAPALDALNRLAGYAELLDGLVKADGARAAMRVGRDKSAVSRLAARIGDLLAGGQRPDGGGGPGPG